MKRFCSLIAVPLLLLLFLSACGNEYKAIDSDMSETVNDFSFTTQDHETLSLEDLKGKWWIADFIFTNCTTVCLPMTYNMSQLQTMLKEEGLDVQLVSFSVDPEYDTPDVLKEYAEEYDVDFSNWSFLTNYDFQTIRELSIKSFRAPLKAPEPGDDQVLHDTRFFLITPEGKVIKGYDGVQMESMHQIVEDLKVVLNETNS